MIKMNQIKGLCHKCFSSNVPITINIKTGKPICSNCFEKSNPNPITIDESGTT